MSRRKSKSILRCSPRTRWETPVVKIDRAAKAKRRAKNKQARRARRAA